MEPKFIFTGTLVNVQGVLLVYNLGKLIALVDSEGKIIWREINAPLFLVEYLIMPQQPSQKSYMYN